MNNNNKNHTSDKKGKTTDFLFRKIMYKSDMIKYYANLLTVLGLVQQDEQRRRRTGTSSQTRH